MGEIKKQSINNSILSYIGAFLGFLTIYLQPFLISSEDIGILRLLYSFSWMVATLMPFGMNSIILRFFPKVKNESNSHNGVFSLIFLFVTITAFILGLIIFSNRTYFQEYYKNSNDFSLYFVEALFLGYIISLISVYTSFSASLLKTSFMVFLTDIFLRLGQLLIIVIYHFDLIDKYGLILSYMSIFLVQLVLMVLYLFKLKAVSFKINWNAFKVLNKKELVFLGILMMVTSFASLSIKVMDQLMIGHFLNERFVGIYATSVMMCVIMEIPFNSLERIAQPKIAHAWSLNNSSEVGKIYEMSSRYMFFIGAILFCLLWAGIDFIYMFLPQEYHQGKMAFYVVSFSSLFNLLTGVNSSVIALSHKYFATSLLLFVLIAVSFVANNMLIEPFGITGAALATLIAISTFNLLKYIYILIRFKMQPFTKHTLYILFSALLCITIILLIPDNWHPLLKAVIGGTAVVVVFSLMNIRFNTIEEVNKIFMKFKLIK